MEEAWGACQAALDKTLGISYQIAGVLYPIRVADIDPSEALMQFGNAAILERWDTAACTVEPLDPENVEHSKVDLVVTLDGDYYVQIPR